MSSIRIMPIIGIDVSPTALLEAARSVELSEVLILGFDRNGEFFFSASKSDGGSVLWLLEQAKKELLE